MHRRAIGLDEGALASLYRPLALLLSYVCNQGLINESNSTLFAVLLVVKQPFSRTVVICIICTKGSILSYLPLLFPGVQPYLNLSFPRKLISHHITYIFLQLSGTGREKTAQHALDCSDETQFQCGSTLSNLPGEGDGLLPWQKWHPAEVTRWSGQQTDSCHQSLALPARCRLTGWGTLPRMAKHTQFTGDVFLPAARWWNSLCH